MAVKASALISLIRVDDGAKGDRGPTGAPGSPGKDGTFVTITSQAITYQASSSGTTVPTGTWVANPPSVAKGQYLWTRTVVNYSDGKKTTAYSVGYQGTNGQNGQNGSPGRGVKSTEITYQIWANGTSTPNGTWTTSVPDTTADKPYLWTRTVITYTDDTKSTSYSVGSTLKGVNVGGRNLFLKTKTNFGEGSPIFKKGEDVNTFSVIWGTYIGKSIADLYPHQSELLIPKVGQTYTIQMMARGRIYKAYAYDGYDLSKTNLLNVKTVEYNNSDGIFNSAVSPYDLISAYSASSPDALNNLKDGTTHTVGSIERIIYRYQNELYDAYFYVLSANGKSVTCYYVFVGKQKGGYIQQFWYPSVYGNQAANSRIEIKVSENWKLYSHQWTPGEKLDAEKKKEMILCRLESDKGVGTIEIYAPKFELGNIATDWTPAPEDVDADINSVNNAASVAQDTANKAMNNAIQAQGTSADAFNKANQAQSSANVASDKAEMAITSSKEAQSLATQAQSLANKANSDAYNAMEAIKAQNQVFYADSTGAHIRKAGTNNETRVVADGVEIIADNTKVAEFTKTQGRVSNLVADKFLYVGSHRLEKFTQDGEVGTGFFWTGGAL